jgi:hypothetical protein
MLWQMPLFAAPYRNKPSQALPGGGRKMTAPAPVTPAAPTNPDKPRFPGANPGQQRGIGGKGGARDSGGFDPAINLPDGKAAENQARRQANRAAGRGLIRQPGGGIIAQPPSLFTPPPPKRRPLPAQFTR